MAKIREEGPDRDRDGDIIPFYELKMQFSMKDSAFLQHLQLRSVLRHCTSKGSKNVLDGKLRDAATGRGSVSVIYKLLSFSQTALSPPNYKGNEALVHPLLWNNGTQY